MLSGCEDQLNGARHERAGGGGEHAQVQRRSEQRGEGGGDQTDGGVQIPLQVHEEQGEGHTHTHRLGIQYIFFPFICLFSSNIFAFLVFFKAPLLFF